MWFYSWHFVHILDGFFSEKNTVSTLIICLKYNELYLLTLVTIATHQINKIN